MKAIKLAIVTLIIACTFQAANAQVRVGLSVGTPPPPRRTVIVEHRRPVVVHRRHIYKRHVYRPIVRKKVIVRSHRRY